MRYGVVRHAEGLPPRNVQRRRVEAAGCDMVLEDSAFGVRRLAHRLVPGDEVVVADLQALDLTTGELARLLRRFCELGVALTVVGESRRERLSPDGPVPRALAWLADYATRRPSSEGGRRRGRAGDAPLTQHQLKFARQMHRQGHSMRAIGLIFQRAPSEMAALLRSAGPDDASEADEPLPMAPAPAPRLPGAPGGA
jgi:hypothetical protein